MVSRTAAMLRFSCRFLAGFLALPEFAKRAPKAHIPRNIAP
jgi:hypothetical protein